MSLTLTMYDAYYICNYLTPVLCIIICVLLLSVCLVFLGLPLVNQQQLVTAST